MKQVVILITAMLFQTPALDANEQEVLDRIEELKRTLGYSVSATPKHWYGLLRRVTFARAVRGSNSIEGYNVTLDDAIAAAEREEPLDAKSEAWAAVTGYQAAMTYVLQGGSWHPERDARPWIRFCLTAHYRQATTLLLRTRELQRLWDALEEEISRKGLPERTMLALADAAIGLKVRNATYRPIADISDNLAGRDLKSLVEHGLLVAEGEKRGRVYVASDVLKAIGARTREARRAEEDPFEG